MIEASFESCRVPQGRGEADNPVGARCGRVAELVYAADLKSAGLNNLVGSSPTSPTMSEYIATKRRDL